MENERKTIDCSKLRPGFGVTIPPGFFDPLERAQSALTAARVGISNTDAARQSPDALRAALNGAGWLLLSDGEREALRN